MVYLLLSEKGEVTRGRFLVKPKRSRYAARLVMKTSIRWKQAVDENTKVFMINIDKWHIHLDHGFKQKRGNTLDLLFIATCETDVRC